MNTQSLGWVLLLSIGLVLFNCWELLTKDPILARDDRALIEPLREVNSIYDYLDLREKLKILDIQPIRDLSLWLNLKAESLLKVQSFHWINLVLWLVSLLLLYRILITLNVSKQLCLGALAIISAHPALLTCVLWVSARKHLLAFVFILWATLRTIQQSEKSKPNYQMQILLAYVLSVFSQPIFVLWPFWAVFFLIVRVRSFQIQQVWPILMCLVGSAFVLKLNYDYYSGSYATLTLTSKFISDFPTAFSGAILAFSRYWVQLFAPFQLAATYYPGTWLNWLGLLFCVAFYFFLRRRLSVSELLCWAFFACLPLIVVLARMTQIFVSDTYLLGLASGIVVLLCLSLRKVRVQPIYFNSMCLLTVLVFSFQSHGWAKAWMSDEALWQYSLKSEPTPRALELCAHYDRENGNWDAALDKTQKLARWAGLNTRTEKLFAQTIYQHPKLTPQNKLTLLRNQQTLSSAWIIYYRSALLAEMKDFEGAYQTALTLTRLLPLPFETEIAFAELTFFCQKTLAKNCQLPDKLPIQKISQWNANAFQKRLNQLTG